MWRTKTAGRWSRVWVKGLGPGIQYWVVLWPDGSGH